MPGKNDVAVISKPVVLDVDARIAGVQIKRGGALIFHPSRRITLRSTGNVVVRGRLKMRPASSRKLHRLLFVGVNENRYRGGGMDVVDRDVGLWVMGAGVLDIAGTRKQAWTRAAGSIAKGTRRITLKADPVGWHVGDEIVITPTVSPRRENHHAAFDKARISAITGRRITLSAPTRFAHPKVGVRRGKVFTAEVLNMTRNVRIEGTPRGRAHIFIRSRRPQEIKFASARFMGPRQPDGEFTKKILGRWVLHFHHCMHDSHGSTVRGVVARDCGSHAFVAHASHGVRFSDCIAYNNLETAYWWDEPTETDKSLTKGTLYRRCVAARLEFDPPHRGGTDLMGFKMAQGANNIARGCVAVGVAGLNAVDGSSGFGWVESGHGLWTFEGCVAHNNNSLGSKFWMNNPNQHAVREFTAYHNRVGSLNGAYGNSVDYINSTYYGNRSGAVTAKATSHKRAQRFVRTEVDQAGLSDYCIEFNEHVMDPPRAIVLLNCSFKGHKKAALGFTNDKAIPDLVDIVDCAFRGNEFWLAADIDPRSRIRVQDSEHGAIQLARWDQVLEGELRPKWNARVKRIRRFA